MPKKILIIHPHGNFIDNPFLNGLIKILIKHSYSIDYLVPDWCKDIVGETSDMNIVYYGFRSKIELSDYYNLIIGIDEDIRFASFLSRIYKCKYCLISFELTFKEEVGFLNKWLDIIASKNISFAICQDLLRAEKLSIENKVDLEKILNIPVAPLSYGTHLRVKNFNLHERLKIDKDKRIVLFMGSTSSFSGLHEIIKNSTLWPDNWVLVINNRWGKKDLDIESNEIERRVFWISESIKSMDDLFVLTDSADLGIAFYKYRIGNSSTGLNIKNIGLSSGKISSYLRFGLPLLTNNIGQYSNIIMENDLGVSVNSAKEIGPILNRFDWEKFSKNCTSYFESNLNFRNFEDLVVNTIRENVSNPVNLVSVKKKFISISIKFLLLFFTILRKLFYHEKQIS
jgi:hypothetical protein